MKRWLCLALPVIILASLVVWRLGQKKAEAEAQMEQRAARKNMPAIVSLTPVEKRSLSQNFEVTGSIEAPLNVKIAPKITGRIEYLELREGDRVHKGQVLVRIDNSEVEANVQQQMANVAEAKFRLAQAQMNQTPTDMAVTTQIRQQKASAASAEADYEQVRTNYNSQVAAVSASLTDAESKIDNARALVKSAQANLENARTKYNRTYNLYKQGYIAAQEVDDAKASVSVQESALEVAQGQLKSATAQRDAAQQQLNIVKTKGKADIEAARAKVTQAHASLDYAKANTSSKSAYRQSIAALRASVEAAEAALRSTKAKRQDTVLVSPLDGFVTGRYADPGAIASPSQPILAVQFTKQVWVTAAVPEEVFAKVHIGRPVEITLDALPGRVFNASIIQVNPSADAQSKQYTVRAVLSNAENTLKPGMFAHVSIETDRIADAVVVPREAVQNDRMGSYVMTVDEGQKAKRVDVITQGEDEDYISIGDSLPVGTKVVTMSAMPVREGQTIVPGGGKPGRDGRGGRPQGDNAR